ncbi:helix-turn-helix transcriptional regulator [Streptomyces sp. NPDC051104]|uniref:helix-turn-helix domain-containing protein n=1 Tax=Streptomyces sp. NPDC051104 TaxID=3155044 RepID=UPI00341F32D9
MGAWQRLPDDLPPEVRHFVEQLRLLKDRTGLSLVALGARTAYSKSSWQRYLNATQPPPRQAVTALCRVAGLEAEEAERFGVRWELAVRAWPRQPAPAPAPAGGPATASAPVGASATAPASVEGSATVLTLAGAPATAPASAGGSATAPASAGSPATAPAGAPAPVPVPGEYEEEPTIPWWDRLEEEPEPRPAGRRLLLAAVLGLLALLVVAVVGAVTFGS